VGSEKWKDCIPCADPTRIQSYIVNVHLSIVTKLEGAFAFLLSKGLCLVDFSILRELAICFYL
jgi:hypothetical protein